MLSNNDALANIAANLTRLRNGKSFSQLARECSTEDETAYPATIERIEKGRNMPGAGLLSRLAEALGVTADDLLSEPPNPPKRKLAKLAG